MPAPDVAHLPEPPVSRPLVVHLHAKFVTPEMLDGVTAVVIDNLRASVTITAALFHGACSVVPALTVDDALAARERLGQGVVLGGERGGILIPGFDLNNSPRAYTPERVRGKTVVFTTVNGTAALLLCRRAARVLVGSFVNLSAVCRAVEADEGPVHLICCGTREEIGLDDVLPAGAMAHRLVAAGRGLTADDSARIATLAWLEAQRAGLHDAMAVSRGGRGMARVGVSGDLPACVGIDSMPILPVYDPRTGTIEIER